jgi:nucleotide-binding universal stress UspA family protein
MQPVMLALSTFRQSEMAISKALEEAKKTKNLLIVYVVDINLERYLIDSEISITRGIEKRAKEELLAEHQQIGKRYVENIEREARKEDILVKLVFEMGRFGVICVDIMEKENPKMIITTRSKRPEWVKKLFGSPVSYLIENATCPVIEV